MSIKFTKCGLCGQSTDNPECHNCPNETMENKIHSYNLLNSKFEIAKKEINKHLQSISDWMRVTDERLEELSDNDERITDLENVSPEIRLLDLQNQIKQLREAYRADAEACKALIFDGARDRERLDSHKERIEKLENKVEELINNLKLQGECNKRVGEQILKISEIISDSGFMQSLKGNKPYKCPVCDANGRTQPLSPTPPYVLHDVCKSCDGKGIVWG